MARGCKVDVSDAFLLASAAKRVSNPIRMVTHNPRYARHVQRNEMAAS